MNNYQKYKGIERIRVDKGGVENSKFSFSIIGN